MKLSNKTLGALSMLGAPFLFVEMYVSDRLHTFHAPVSGLLDLVYMLGWMCSVIALLRLKATGIKKSSAIVLYIQLGFLTLANISNIWVMLTDPGDSQIFFVLDLFWPISNIWMLVVGIIIARTGRLQGWRRYIVLAVGCWFPVILLSSVLLGKTEAMFYVCGIYSVIAWSLMGWAIVTVDKKEEQQLAFAIQ